MGRRRSSGNRVIWETLLLFTFAPLYYLGAARGMGRVYALTFTALDITLLFSSPHLLWFWPGCLVFGIFSSIFCSAYVDDTPEKIAPSSNEVPQPSAEATVASTDAPPPVITATVPVQPVPKPSRQLARRKWDGPPPLVKYTNSNGASRRKD